MSDKINSMTVNTMKIENGKKSQDFQQIRMFLNQQLEERKNLTNQLKGAQKQRESCQKDYNLHLKMVEEFPSHLEGIEKALKPVQQYLNQVGTDQGQIQVIDDTEKAIIELLPQCLKTLYHKFKLLQQWGHEGLRVSLESSEGEQINLQQLKISLAKFYKRHETSKLCQNTLMQKASLQTKDDGIEADLEITKQ